LSDSRKSRLHARPLAYGARGTMEAGHKGNGPGVCTTEAVNLEAQGYLNERGQRFAAASVKAMLGE
jgi:hypothetical protein